MDDYSVAFCIDELEGALKAFVFFWQMGDHVMYRARAEDILEFARQLHDESHLEDSE